MSLVSVDIGDCAAEAEQDGGGEDNQIYQISH
jgi:hypothetical protein